MTKAEHVAEALIAVESAERKVAKMAAHLAGAQQALSEAQAALSLAEAMPDDPTPDPAFAPAGLPMSGGSAAAHSPTVMTQDYT